MMSERGSEGGTSAIRWKGEEDGKMVVMI